MATLLYRRLDQHGDMLLGSGPGEFASDLEAVTQSIYTRLRLLRGEWWERPQDGLPLFQRILGRPCTDAQRTAVDLILIDRITDTLHVTGTSNSQSWYEGRTYHFRCSVQTEFGETTVEVSY